MEHLRFFGTLFARFLEGAHKIFGKIPFYADNNFRKSLSGGMAISPCLADNLKNVSHWGEGWGSGLGAGSLSSKGSGLTFKQGLALLCI